VEKEKKVEHIAPRHAQKKQGTEGVYKDRAELRRAGKDDEYKDVCHGTLSMGRLLMYITGRENVGGFRETES